MSSQIETRNDQRPLAKSPARRVRKRRFGEMAGEEMEPSGSSGRVIARQPKAFRLDTISANRGGEYLFTTTPFPDGRPRTTRNESALNWTLPVELPADSSVGLPLKVPDQTPPKLALEYRSGDLFDAPPGTVLIHSCNCAGHWGKGIALQFRKRYHDAYETYHDFCRRTDVQHILGKAMLIGPPSDTHKEEAKRGHYIGCLFTRDRPVSKDFDGDPIEILQATESAVKGLLAGIQQSMQKGEIGPITELRMPMINSGLFRVPWELTEAVLEGLDVLPGEHSISKIVVYKLATAEILRNS